MSNIKAFVFSIFFLFTGLSQAAPDSTQLAVWVNEAIVATYTFNASNYLDRQRDIAKYFTAQGWTNYITALNTSGLPDTVKTNSYAVSAVALAPPEVSVSNDGQSWKASMPLLVVYKNPQFKQQQTLQVDITFVEAASNQGVRGLAMNSLQAKVSTPPCQCMPVEPTTAAATAPAGADQSGTVKAQ